MSALVCGKCGLPLGVEKTTFRYMGYEVYEDLPRCLKCGQVYIDEELASGRIAEVETEFEDK